MHDVLLELGFVLLVLFAGGALANRFRQSVIPAYILVGLLSQGFVVNLELLETLASVGLILLLFFIGLEFSLRSFLLNWRRTLFSGVIDLGFNFPVGVAFGLIAGMGVTGSVFLGAIVYMSSTAIITKTMVDSRLSAMPESEVVLRILVFEDLLIAVLLALLAGVAGGGGGTGGAWAPVLTVAKVAGFFVVLTYVFRKALPLVNSVFSVESPELFIMLGLGLVVVVASIAASLDISEAVGAFVAGMLFAETAHKGRLVEKLGPFRDLCAAIFFLYFGMTISLSGIGTVVVPALTLTLLGFAGKLAGGFAVGRSEGLSDRASLGAGFGLLARGEFSIILASMLPAGAAAAAGYDIAALTAIFVLISGILGAVAMREYPKLYFMWVRRGKKPVAPPG